MFFVHVGFSQTLNPAPDRKDGEGEGPFERLIIRGTNVIDGTGAPPRGPVDIVIEGNKIVSIVNVGVPNVPIKEDRRPHGATKEIDAYGAYVLPGFINLHAHVGGAAKSSNAEYPFKLWMAHGITTIRGVPAANVAWTQAEKRRSAENKIVAPRIIAFQLLGQGENWTGGQITTRDKAREWVQWASRQDVEGVKFYNWDRDILKATIAEAHKYNMGTVAHLSQLMISQTNALDAARLGLDNMTHFYGLFEAQYKDEDIQHWPADFGIIYDAEKLREDIRQMVKAQK